MATFSQKDVRNGNNWQILSFFAVIFLQDATLCASFKYLGCYTDRSGTLRDLSGKAMVLPGLTAGLCSSLCQSNGYAYAGLQLTQQCFCGTSYGQYGASLRCNTTCAGQFCGGDMANDVYYTVDQSLESERDIVLQVNASKYEYARMTCVSAKGDLARVDSVDILDDLQEAIQNATASTKKTIPAAYVGLAVFPGLGLTWCDLYGKAYLSQGVAMSEIWDPSDSQAGPCVQYNTSLHKLQSVSCSAQLPFFCDQIPPVTAEESGNGTASPDTQGDSKKASQQTALLIVVPIFFCCYGGSCVVYCIHKIYISCTKGQILASLMENEEPVHKLAPSQPPTFFPFPDKPILSQPYEISAKRKMMHQYREYIEEPLPFGKQPATYKPMEYPGGTGDSRPATATSVSVSMGFDNHAMENDDLSTKGAAAAPPRPSQRPPSHPQTPRINDLSGSTLDLLSQQDDKDASTRGSTSQTPAGTSANSGTNGENMQSIGEILQQKVARKANQST